MNSLCGRRDGGEVSAIGVGMEEMPRRMVVLRPETEQPLVTLGELSRTALRDSVACPVLFTGPVLVPLEGVMRRIRVTTRTGVQGSLVMEGSRRPLNSSWL